MQSKIKIIYLAGFLLSIPIAVTSYINSSFLESFFSEYQVSLLYIVASILTILGMLEMPRLLNRLGNKTTTFLFSILCLISLLILAFSTKPMYILSAFILFFASQNFLIATLDIFLEDFSKNKSVGKLRGLYLTVINLAWVISQAISGSIIDKSSFQGIYIFGSLFIFLFSLIFIFFLHDFKDPKYTKIPLFKTMKFFWRNKNILRVYASNFILKFFFVWMVIYTPIYLNQSLGFNWDKIGLIFTIMLMPFVLLTYPLGKLSDRIGEKKMLIIGYVIASIFTLSIPFIKSTEFWIWALVLFATRVGAATIEIMTESYFFKRESEKDADAISFFRNTNPLSFIIGPLIALPIIYLVPNFSYLFYILSAILMSGILIILRLKDIK